MMRTKGLGAKDVARPNFFSVIHSPVGNQNRRDLRGRTV